MGSFYDGHPDDYVRGTKSPRQYRNLFLVEAMTQLNLIDHIGYGKVFLGKTLGRSIGAWWIRLFWREPGS
ncbi:hypothetical protein [Nesterenkonia massiliensis]|uniref:hypothetical protein n=1 Tax=Nesterenkonia massiliensis TaxID=1232429 RepID=UPI003898F733